MTQNQDRRYAEGIERLLHDIRTSSSHLTEDELAAYATDFLDSQDKANVEQHLRSCDICREEMRQMSEAAQAWTGDEGRQRLTALSASVKRGLLPGPMQRLMEALQHLVSQIKDDVEKARLVAWQKQLIHNGAVPEVTVRAAVSASRRLESVSDLSNPSAKFNFATAGTTLITPPSTSPRHNDRISVTTEAISKAEVSIRGNNIHVWFSNWQGASMPLVMLVPEEDAGSSQLPGSLERSGDGYTAKFSKVASGEYIIAIAPPGLSE